MIKLLFLNQDAAGKAYEIPQNKTTVGRSKSNSLVIHDPSVSSHHCEFLTYRTEVILVETGSTNGTFVDGRRIKEQTQVTNGQLIRFGDVEARLMILPEGHSERDTEVTTMRYLSDYEADQRRKAKHPDKPIHDEIGNEDNVIQDNTVLYPKDKKD